MIRTLAILLAASTTAQADHHTWQISERTVLTASETVEADCAFRIDIYNHSTDVHRRMTGVLGVKGIAVKVTYTLNVAALAGERYDFEPPDGYFAAPPSIDVTDGDRAFVLICPERALLGS